MLGLCGLFGFKLWLDHVKKPDPTDKYEARFKKLEGAISAYHLDNNKVTGSKPKNKYSW